MGGGASRDAARPKAKEESPGEIGRRRMSIGTASNASVGAEHDGGLQDAHFHSITVSTTEAKTEYSPRSDKRRYSISFSDQQDITQQNTKKQGILFGVIDGHGPHGKIVAEYLQKEIPKKFARMQKECKGIFDPKATLPKILLECDEDLLLKESDDAAGIDITASGASCTVAFYRNGRLYISNVGDATGMLCCGSDPVHCIQLTCNHYPEVPLEKLRIEKEGGEVRKWKLDNVGEVGKPSVWYGRNHPKFGKREPGISLSRTIGYTSARKIGVINQPDTNEFKLLNGPWCVVLATKGLWEVVNGSEAAQVCCSKDIGNGTEASRKLTKIACDKWVEQWTGEDVTVQVFYTGDVGSAVNSIEGDPFKMEG